MKLPTLASLVSLTFIATTACGTKQRSGPVTWTDGPAVPTVTVQNDNWLDVAIYLVRGASRFRIGTVRGTSTETFRLTHEGNTANSPVQIMADPIGATRGYVTEPVVLGPGQRLELKVGSPINISSFSVWNR